MPEAQKQAVAEPTKAKPPVGDGFGLSLAAAKKHDGVLIAKVDPNGSAADSGLQEGDLIASVGNVKVATPDEFEKQVKAARDRCLKAVLLQVTNGKETRFVALSLGSG